MPEQPQSEIDDPSMELVAPRSTVPPLRLRIGHYLLFTVAFFVTGAVTNGWSGGEADAGDAPWLGELYTGCSSLLFAGA